MSSSPTACLQQAWQPQDPLGPQPSRRPPRRWVAPRRQRARRGASRRARAVRGRRRRPSQLPRPAKPPQHRQAHPAAARGRPRARRAPLRRWPAPRPPPLQCLGPSGSPLPASTDQPQQAARGPRSPRGPRVGRRWSRGRKRWAWLSWNPSTAAWPWPPVASGLPSVLKPDQRALGTVGQRAARGKRQGRKHRRHQQGRRF
mmetsp:Transcript_142821/g.456379  ORF Transcript_142821/g.456379 Transcript_142821/m.456379 type:complete len:201 (-) Transcript_142821:1143-1745(-)